MVSQRLPVRHAQEGFTVASDLVTSPGGLSREPDFGGPAQRLLLAGHPGEWRNWQTRRIQVPVSERMCGFKSRLAHQIDSFEERHPEAQDPPSRASGPDWNP